MKHTRRKILPILVTTALLAAACGDDDDSADDAATDDAATDDAATDDAATDDAATDDAATDDAAGSGLEGTLRVLIHQNPSGVEFIENFNADFEAANPGVTVDLRIVNADDIPTQNQTQLTANDIDITTISVTGFANPVQDYMTDAEPPYWQQLIDAGLLMDISDQAYVANYDDAANDSSSYNGSQYAVALGRTTYSGMFVNEDILGEAGVEIPTTWDELVSSCGPIEDAGYKCMIAGGADSWPVFVGSYGLLGALYPDQQALVEGLWTGAAAWNDEQGLELFDRYATYASLLDAESAGLGGDAAASRYAIGDVAYGPMGGWNAALVDEATFEWEYIPFPGSSDAADNQTFFGKVDMSLAVAADTPVPELAHAWMAAFSEPDTYNAFANATNYIPTQPTAALDSNLGASIAPLLQQGNFAIGFEQWYVGPTGAGQWANGSQAALWLYTGDFGSGAEAAEASQADLASGL
ncbi:MAG: extracellular solute-binding protein [Ilumatobacter sp.]|uniref:ABC transporter substrate-binding protein n=1 Tax=Ilumatobacter sp. TaxID=1967498 RepID=UPI002608B2C1|nr:extracellular solute-binding protein [Ilumatobacter sp.]MDJ0770518.1 extracellular solute-binding protein [Ilumatobacter sp.]